MPTHRILAATALAFLLLQSMRPATAQTTAIQGLTDPDGSGDVKKKWVTMDDMPGYQCEGVSLQQVRVRATRQRNGSLGLRVKTDTYTIPGRDKWADLLFELVMDGEVIASDLIQNVDAEEKTRRHVSRYLEVPSSELVGQEKPVLKITVTVTED